MSDENFTPKEAPNNTTAFFAMATAITFFALWIISGVFGFVWVILSASVAEIAYHASRPRS
ncbi:MAG: hypothetical protein AAFZ02_01650 [Pseudomonadota bacterium]